MPIFGTGRIKSKSKSEIILNKWLLHGAIYVFSLSQLNCFPKERWFFYGACHKTRFFKTTNLNSKISKEGYSNLVLL
jgi:hypothetical protein